MGRALTNFPSDPATSGALCCTNTQTQCINLLVPVSSISMQRENLDCQDFDVF